MVQIDRGPRNGGLIQGHPAGAAEPLGAAPAPGVVHQDAANHPRGDREEMRPVPQVQSGGVDKPDIRLVDDLGCLQRVVRPFVCKVFVGQATELHVARFEQLVDASASVVYGRVVDVRSQWTDDRRFIESVVSIEVITDMKGGARDRISFTTPGGQVGRYLNVIPGAPVFAPGDTAVFFLTSRGPRLPVTTGLTQGIYRVQRDARSGEMLVMPPNVDAPGRVIRGSIARKPTSLAAFEATVRSVGNRAR